MTLTEAYTALDDILDREKHGPDCAWRCLVPGCRADHSCVACDEWPDGAIYEPPTKGKDAK